MRSSRSASYSGDPPGQHGGPVPQPRARRREAGHPADGIGADRDPGGRVRAVPFGGDHRVDRHARRRTTPVSSSWPSIPAASSPIRVSAVVTISLSGT